MANKILKDRPLPDLKDSLNLGSRNFNFPIFISSFFIFLFICYNAVSAYTPPIGIPDPGYWGSIHPIDSDAPGTATTCPDWPSSQAANCFYVDNSLPCSSSGNGYPDYPRCSIPPLLSSGAYVEVHGGPYDLPNGHPDDGTKIMITATGTQDNPVWIRGPGAGREPVLQLQTLIKGQYVLMEFLQWNRIHATLELRSHRGSSLNHAIIRNSILIGDKTNTQNDAAIGINGDTLGEAFNDIIVYNNIIHDFGDSQASKPNIGDMNDYHGVKVGSYAFKIWLLNNQIYDLGGDAIQVGDYNYQDQDNERPHHIYIGRNTLFGNHEDGVDVKKARDVIISQNTIYGNTGTGTVFHYGPDYVWVLYNKIHTLSQGIVTGGGLADQTYYGGTDHAYFIGNLIYNIHHDPNDQLWQQGKYSWSNGAAFQVFDAKSVRVVNNTLYDYDIGIQRPDPLQEDYPWDPRGPCHLINNIFSNRAERNGYDIIYNVGTIPASSEMDNNLFYGLSGPIRINWGDEEARDLAGFQSVYQKGIHSLAGDPKFVNPSELDFHLLSDSPAIDNGVLDIAYQTFYNLYGLSIAYDFSGAVRPNNSKWDIGAYEWPPLPIVTTGSATNVTGHSATLNGTVNCNELSTTYYFEWGLTTSYGNTTPNPPQSAGSGTSNVSVSANLTGLTLNAIYHYRLVATNNLGTTYGSDLTFRTLADTTPPSLNITSHSNGQHVTTSGITLIGTASDSGKEDNGVQQVTVNGSRADNDTATGSGTANWSKAITLSPGANVITVIAYDNSTNHNSTTVILTIYYYSAPSTTTGSANNVTQHSATLNGTVNFNGLSTTYYFEWGLTTSYGNTTPNPPQSAGSGTSNVSVSANLTGLTLNATYHYRLAATNSLGTTYGSDMTFRTLEDTTPPSLDITSHVNGQHVTTSVITLTGTASDSGKEDNGVQQVIVNGSRADNDTATGSGTANWSKAITLNPGANSITVTAYDNSTNHNSTTVILTIYYDLARAPSVTTGPATNMTQHSATLNGTVNPNGLSTTYYFEWGPTASYGNKLLTTPASAGSGWDNDTVSANLTGLILNTTYHYRLVAINSLGTSYGSDMSFKAVVNPLPWLMLLLD